jgi:hypothetical protein
MPLPEWGYSYNALYVPLTSDWQCSLVPARDVGEPTSWWNLSYDERKQKRKDREKQIEQDQRDFDRLFRVSTNRRAARGCSDFSAYAAFIRDHLRISGLSTPVDGDGVTRILRDAVRDGYLVPAIDRAWRGSRRVSRLYAPQSWPKRAPDPKPTVYGVRDGQFIPLNADGSFVDYTPYVPVKDRVAAAASSAASSGSGFDWPDAVETAAGAVLGGDTDSGEDDGGGDGVVENEDFISDASDDSTPLGDAQPFDYQPDMPAGDDEQVAARGVRMTGNEPGGFAINPNGLDVDYFDSDGNLSAQYHGSHGDPHGHNFSDGVRDHTHLPMSPINFDQAHAN